VEATGFRETSSSAKNRSHKKIRLTMNQPRRKPEPVKVYRAHDLPEDSKLFPKPAVSWRTQPISKRQIAKLSGLGVTREDWKDVTQGWADDMIVSRSTK